MNPIDLNRLMWLGLGAGCKGIIAGMVSGLAPEAGIAPEIGSAVAGFFLAQQGGNRLGPLGEGMLIASAGQLVRKPIEGVFGRLKLGPAGESSSSSSNPGNPGEPKTLAEYNKQMGRT